MKILRPARRFIQSSTPTCKSLPSDEIVIDQVGRENPHPCRRKKNTSLSQETCLKAFALVFGPFDKQGALWVFAPKVSFTFGGLEIQVLTDSKKGMYDCQRPFWGWIQTGRSQIEVQV